MDLMKVIPTISTGPPGKAPPKADAPSGQENSFSDHLQTAIHSDTPKKLDVKPKAEEEENAQTVQTGVVIPVIVPVQIIPIILVIPETPLQVSETTSQAVDITIAPSVNPVVNLTDGDLHAAVSSSMQVDDQANSFQNRLDELTEPDLKTEVQPQSAIPGQDQKVTEVDETDLPDGPKGSVTETQKPVEARPIVVEAEQAKSQPVLKNEVEPVSRKAGLNTESLTKEQVAAAYNTVVKQVEDPVIQAARPVEVARQVSDQLQSMLRNGQTTLRIQVVPENLGRIDLRLVSNSSGTQVFITADLPSTGKLLENQLGQLHQALLDAGVKLGGLSVANQGFGGNFSGMFNNQSAHRYVFASSPDSTSGREDELAGVGQLNRAAMSGLDYLI
jgi:flagellar hook-length control protein FliK